MSSLPLGKNWIPIKRAINDNFNSDFCSVHDTGIIYGWRIHLLRSECLSNNLIMADRKKLKNPNGLILGTPGSW